MTKRLLPLLGAIVLTAASAFAQAPAETPPSTTAAVTPDPSGAAQTPPPPPDSISLASGKIRLGAVFFTDWAYYNKTGFGPQFVTQTNFPGPGNDSFNTFDVHRTYLNVYFSPTDWVTFRLTPNLFREIGGTTADRLSRTSGMAPTVDGNLTLRIKYAYLEFPKVFEHSPALKGTNIRLGSQMNPLVDWEEALYDYRFAVLVPWNYLSLSSTQVGASLNGAVRSGGKQYLDFQVGAYNNTNFHQFEQAEEKQFMARGSVYPFGATSRFQGLGITAFYDHGYTNTAPDTGATPVVRTATLVHFTTPHNGAAIVGEFDTGKGAFGVGNMFSGSAPQDLLGLGTTPYAGMASLSQAILTGPGTRQRGYALFGRANIPNSQFAVFGLWNAFQPNTEAADNPLDFNRIIGGMAYRFNRNLRLAVSSQNVLYRHDQFTYPAESLRAISPALAAAHPNGIANAVPGDIRAVFVSMEFVF